MKRIHFPALTVLVVLTLISCGPREVAEVGKPAPNFVLQGSQGTTVDLSTLKGQVVFVNFWATWCPPCREEMPSMQALFRSLPADKFKMLAILYKDKYEVAQSYASKLRLTFPILDDPEMRASQAYGITGVPETFIIDAEGIVREKIIGPKDWNSPEARQLVMKYLTP